jgi:hypothetical protein
LRGPGHGQIPAKKIPPRPEVFYTIDPDKTTSPFLLFTGRRKAVVFHLKNENFPPSFCINLIFSFDATYEYANT